jgi:hypothetical protein
MRLFKDLDNVDDYLEEERNKLQIEAQAFEHIRHQLSRTLRDTQGEIEALEPVDSAIARNFISLGSG